VTLPALRRPVAGDVSGAFADLGIFIPLSAALVLVNGLSAGMVLVVAGLLVVTAGVRFGIPFPVQPLKALTAVAVARQLPAEVIAAAGLVIGVVLLLVSAGNLADRIARFFSATTVRALQCGVGLLLVLSAVRLALDPPAVFFSAPPAGPSLLALQLPGLPSAAAFTTAFVLLVIPQLPLTFGNAVVAVTDVARRTFGPDAAAVTPSRVCRTAGAGNVAAALLGGMPMCHGSSGLTAHRRLGARTAWMNVGLGAGFIGIGVAFGDQAPAVLGQLPPVVLAVLLGYAGVRHALLVADLRGARLALAIGAGLLGAVLGNLAITMAVVMTVEATTGLVGRRVGRSPATG
jgi:sulfate permease, SulP family